MRIHGILIVFVTLLLLQNLSGLADTNTMVTAAKEIFNNPQVPRKPLETQQINITMISYEFVPNNFTVTLGDTVNLTLTNNDSSISHAFSLDYFGINETILPNASTFVTFVANETGEFIYYSYLYNDTHPEMNGTMTIESPIGSIESLEVDKLTQHADVMQVNQTYTYRIKVMSHHDESLFNISFIEDYASYKKIVKINNTEVTFEAVNVTKTDTRITCKLSELTPNNEFWLWIDLNLKDVGNVKLKPTNVTYAFSNGTKAWALSNGLEFDVEEVPETSKTNTFPDAPQLDIFDGFDGGLLLSGIIVILPLVFLVFTSLFVRKSKKPMK